MRQLHDLELEPDVRDWLDSLSDSDYKRVDELFWMLAAKGTQLGGPWFDHLDGDTRWRVSTLQLTTPNGSPSARPWPSARRCTTGASRSA